MPLYNYKCQKCEHTFQVIQKFDEPAPPCPARVFEDDATPCGGETERQMSQSSFQLKGSGWFNTGY